MCDKTSTQTKKTTKHDNMTTKIPNQHQLTRSIRKSLCRAVASLPKNSSNYKSVETALNEAVSKCYLVSEHDDDDGSDDTVTPIMIACDKDQPHALKHLIHMKSSYDVEAAVASSIGCVYATAGPETGDNTAAHFAAYSGSVSCLEILFEVEQKTNSNNNSNSNNNNNNNSDDDPARSILISKNAHDDTPCMIAVISNQIQVLQYYLDLALPPPRGALLSGEAAPRSQSKSQQCPILQAHNQNGDTVLSLSYGHGRVDMVRLIVDRLVLLCDGSDTDGTGEGSLRFGSQSARGEILHRGIQSCGALLKKMRKKRVSMNANGSEKVIWEGKEKLVTECHVLLKNVFQEYEQKAMRMEALLLQDEIPGSDGLIALKNKEQRTITKIKKSKANRKKRNKRKGKGKGSASVLRIRGDCANKDNDDNKTIEKRCDADLSSPSSASRFVTLENGCVVADIRRASLDGADPESDTASLAIHQAAHQPVAIASETDKLFHKLCPEAESLSLEPHTMLLSAHGMAMQLSPCQLEVISRLLESQFSNVSEARKIQSRLMRSQQEGGEAKT